MNSIVGLTSRKVWRVVGPEEGGDISPILGFGVLLGGNVGGGEMSGFYRYGWRENLVPN
jgi:hypothetical protein